MNNSTAESSSRNAVVRNPAAPGTNSASAPATLQASAIFESAPALLERVLQRVEDAHQIHLEGGWTGGLRCNLPLVDDVLHGFRPRSFSVLNAEPNIGKSTLCNQIAYDVATYEPESNVSVLYVTFENSSDNLMVKHLSRLTRRKQNGAECGWSVDDIEFGAVDPNDKTFQDAVSRLKSTPLFYLAGEPSETEILQRAEQIKSERDGPLFIVVDYLQQYARNFTASNNTEMVGAALRSLRKIVVQTDAALLTIGSQNRAANMATTDYGKFTGRGSGDIEYEADFLFTLKETQSDKARKTLKLKIEKSRFRRVSDECHLEFNPDFACFSPM